MSFFFSFESLEKINKLFTALGSERIVENCDLGLERLERPQATSGSIFKTSVISFFTTRTSQPAYNIYIYISLVFQSTPTYVNEMTRYCKSFSTTEAQIRIISNEIINAFIIFIYSNTLERCLKCWNKTKHSSLASFWMRGELMQN